jgi:hypothetical protein
MHLVVAPSDAEPAWQDPPLHDPFLGKNPPPPPKPPFAPAALASALLALLPVGSMAAIPVGIVGLRQTRFGTLRGRWLAILSISFGVVASVAYGGAIAYFAVDQVTAARREAVLEEERRERRKRERAEVDEPDPSRVVPAPLIVPNLSSGTPPGGTVPKDTRVQTVGEVPVVDLGVGEESLRGALVREMATAKTDGKDVLLMTTRSGCAPCDGVMKSLSDPTMQDALKQIRIVRADVQVYGDDLAKLGIQRDAIPGFFLMAPDGTPRDGIDGGEWNEDIPKNIAPVLGPFVRGQYKNRKKEYRPAPGGGVFL